ncbi:MAG TPA: RnfABCDGE type electron transport complex subunit G [Lachnospiraceae bacterium]|nr:RnfABCDGE type electron transport complex subunit G [Lachnospiraceae bacterium]
MNTTVKNTLILTIITVIAGLLLGYVYDITKEPIAVQKEKAKNEAYLKVFETASSFEEVEGLDLSQSDAVLKEAGLTEQSIDEVLAAKAQDGSVLGYVMSVTTKEGYGGDITFSMGITNDGVMNGYEVLSISETAGLGMKAADDAFMSQFANKKVANFAYTKTGATADFEVDAISGATITTNAIVNGVNAGLTYFASITTEGGAQNE